MTTKIGLIYELLNIDGIANENGYGKLSVEDVPHEFRRQVDYS